MKPIPSAESAPWNIADGNRDGKPVMLRYRPDLEAFLGDARYPRRLTILWTYPCGRSSGLPTDDQFNEMRDFEDLLQAELDRDRTAILAFSRTHAGCRCWTYYFADKQLLSQQINAALANHPNLPIKLEAEDDSQWTAMRTILEQCHE